MTFWGPSIYLAAIGLKIKGLARSTDLMPTEEIFIAAVLKFGASTLMCSIFDSKTLYKYGRSKWKLKTITIQMNWCCWKHHALKMQLKPALLKSCSIPSFFPIETWPCWVYCALFLRTENFCYDLRVSFFCPALEMKMICEHGHIQPSSYQQSSIKCEDF